MREDPARRAARHDRRRAPQPDPRPHGRGRPDPDVRRPVHRRRAARRRDEPVVLVHQTTARWNAPHFVWAVRDELATKLCGEDATCPQLDHGGLRVTTTLDLDLQKTAEKWVKAAAVVPNQDNPRRAAKAPRLQVRALDGQPGRQAPAQRRARRDRLPDRRAGRLCRQRRLLRDQAHEALPAAVRRRRQGLPPAGFGVQAVQLRDRHRRRASSPPARC